MIIMDPPPFIKEGLQGTREAGWIFKRTPAHFWWFFIAPALAFLGIYGGGVAVENGLFLSRSTLLSMTSQLAQKSVGVRIATPADPSYSLRSSPELSQALIDLSDSPEAETAFLPQASDLLASYSFGEHLGVYQLRVPQDGKTLSLSYGDNENPAIFMPRSYHFQSVYALAETKGVALYQTLLAWYQ